MSQTYSGTISDNGSLPLGLVKLQQGVYSVEISSGDINLLPFKAVIKASAQKSIESLPEKTLFDSNNATELRPSQEAQNNYSSNLNEKNIQQINEKNSLSNGFQFESDVNNNFNKDDSKVIKTEQKIVSDKIFSEGIIENNNQNKAQNQVLPESPEFITSEKNDENIVYQSIGNFSSDITAITNDANSNSDSDLTTNTNDYSSQTNEQTFQTLKQTSNNNIPFQQVEEVTSINDALPKDSIDGLTINKPLTDSVEFNSNNKIPLSDINQQNIELAANNLDALSSNNINITDNKKINNKNDLLQDQNEVQIKEKNSVNQDAENQPDKDAGQIFQRLPQSSSEKFQDENKSIDSITSNDLNLSQINYSNKETSQANNSNLSREITNEIKGTLLSSTEQRKLPESNTSFTQNQNLENSNLSEKELNTSGETYNSNSELNLNQKLSSSTIFNKNNQGFTRDIEGTTQDKQIFTQDSQDFSKIGKDFSQSNQGFTRDIEGTTQDKQIFTQDSQDFSQNNQDSNTSEYFDNTTTKSETSENYSDDYDGNISILQNTNFGKNDTNYNDEIRQLSFNNNTILSYGEDFANVIDKINEFLPYNFININNDSPQNAINKLSEFITTAEFANLDIATQSEIKNTLDVLQKKRNEVIVKSAQQSESFTAKNQANLSPFNKIFAKKSKNENSTRPDSKTQSTFDDLNGIKQKISLTFNKLFSQLPESGRNNLEIESNFDQNELTYSNSEIEIEDEDYQFGNEDNVIKKNPRISGVTEAEDLDYQEELRKKKKKKKELQYLQIGANKLQNNSNVQDNVQDAKEDDLETSIYKSFSGERNRFADINLSEQEQNKIALRKAEHDIQQELSKAIKDEEVIKSEIKDESNDTLDNESIIYKALSEERLRFQEALENERENNKASLRRSEDQIQKQLMDLIVSNPSQPITQAANDPVSQIVKSLVEKGSTDKEQIIIDATRIIQMIQNNTQSQTGQELDEYLLRQKIERELKYEFRQMQIDHEKKMKLIYRKMIEDMYIEMLNS